MRSTMSAKIRFIKKAFYMLRGQVFGLKYTKTTYI